jgi:hypothetical protein
MDERTEDFVDSTIAGLKVIGMVPKNGKLAVKRGQLCLDTPLNAQGLRRWLNGDSREMTLMHVKNTVSNAVRIGRMLIARAEQQQQQAAAAASSDAPSQAAAAEATLRLWTLDRIATELEKSEAGLLNLKTTYANDSTMLANIDVMVDRQRAHRSEISQFMYTLQNSSLESVVV